MTPWICPACGVGVRGDVEACPRCVGHVTVHMLPPPAVVPDRTDQPPGASWPDRTAPLPRWIPGPPIQGLPWTITIGGDSNSSNTRVNLPRAT